GEREPRFACGRRVDSRPHLLGWCSTLPYNGDLVRATVVGAQRRGLSLALTPRSRFSSSIRTIRTTRRRGACCARHGPTRPANSVCRTPAPADGIGRSRRDRKSTRLNSSDQSISYAVCCFHQKKVDPRAGWPGRLKLLCAGATQG